jgi:hypothetical protein
MKTTKKLLILSATIAISSFFTSCSTEKGCTDSLAINFDKDAEKDDGSCIYPAPTNNDQSHDHTNGHVTLVFNHHFDGLPVTSSTFNDFRYITANNDTISITKLKYLLSGFKLFKTNGDSIEFHGYSLFDIANPIPTDPHHRLKHDEGSGLTFPLHDVEKGAYASLGFTFGFDSTDNLGNYSDLNVKNWNWPAGLGGGYHFMQFEGQYKHNGNDSTFVYHHGTAFNGPDKINHIPIKLTGVAFNENNVVVNIDVNLADWFRSPYLWDLNTYHNMLMPNYTAQKMMQANGHNVFSINSVIQRRK